jgi:cold shock protein
MEGTGTIHTIRDQGFGFIKPDGGSDSDKDIFFHSTDLVGVGFDDLVAGETRVTYTVEKGPKGLAAKNVNLAESE